jgi:hypothetical protein
MSETKEEVYDSTVFPLMQQIIETCRAAGIGFIASFELDADPDDPADPLRCTTIIPPDNGGEFASPAMREGRDALKPEAPRALAITETTKPDGKVVLSVRRIS